MHLWTEYEGRTIAQGYTLGKLLRSEGRNGFFATADKEGHPAVIRLTEAHFDEAEQLKRWRQVAEVHQDNLIEIEQVGQTTLEGVALTYALMEPDDANLGDVLKERPLTTAEAQQVAKSVLAALMALHESGLVHEHVEAANVLAVGETVKLRSDCVRECVVDGEFTTDETCAELRRKDIHDYGTLLLHCLTLEKELTPSLNLPEPFRRIVPSALDGTWGLQQIGTVLDPVTFAPKPVTPPYQAAAPSPVAPYQAPASSPSGTQRPSPVQSSASAPAAPGAAPSRPLVPQGVLNNTSAAHEADPPSTAARRPAEPAIPVRSRFTADEPEQSSGPSKGVLAAGAIGLLLIVFLIWHFVGGSKPAQPESATPASATRSTAPVQPAAPSTPTPAAPLASAETAIPAAGPTTAGTSAHGWYVVAFTYNHESQAQTKVERLRRNHNSLHPQLFTPNGRAPFFVSLGGPMPSQDEAEAVWRHARRAGLPRDTFVRHY